MVRKIKTSINLGNIKFNIDDYNINNKGYSLERKIVDENIIVKC